MYLVIYGFAFDFMPSSSAKTNVVLGVIFLINIITLLISHGCLSFYYIVILPYNLSHIKIKSDSVSYKTIS